MVADGTQIVADTNNKSAQIRPIRVIRVLFFWNADVADGTLMVADTNNKSA